MEDKQKYWFFGSKLNTFLLLILIILMAVALKWMYQYQTLYFSYGKLDANPSGLLNSKLEGDVKDLIYFSIFPGQEVSGKVSTTGILQGGYFFEGNLPVAILDANKNVTKYGPGYGQATGEWMTKGPVGFAIDFDFSTIPKGKAYIKITQDDPSGEESGRLIRSVLIPVVIK
jgi:hypothetical protein